MSKFIKLTNTIINTKYIRKIVLHNNPHEYRISMTNNKIDGFFLMGSGLINNHENEIIISKNKIPEDYNKITEWIDKECK